MLIIHANDSRSTRSSSYPFAVTATRQSMALYAAWQFGPGRASQMVKGIAGFGPVGFFRSRRAADRVAASLRTVVNYQRGRLGLPMNDGGIFVQ